MDGEFRRPPRLSQLTTPTTREMQRQTAPRPLTLIRAMRMAFDGSSQFLRVFTVKHAVCHEQPVTLGAATLGCQAGRPIQILLPCLSFMSMST